MSACATLLELYQEWRRWTESEGDAILAGNWPLVRRCQAAKGELQSRILDQTDKAQHDCDRSGIDRTAFDKQLRTCVNELIYLETRNGEFLREQRDAAEEQQASLERSSRNLPQIRMRYAQQRGVAWESYS